MVIETQKKTLGQLLLEWHGPKAKALQAKGPSLELFEMRLSVATAFNEMYSIDERVLIRNLQGVHDLLFPQVRETIDPNCGSCIKRITNRISAEQKNLEREVAKLKGEELPTKEAEPSKPIDQEPASNTLPGSYVYIVAIIEGVPSLQLAVAKIHCADGKRTVDNLTTGEQEDVPISSIHNTLSMAHQAYNSAKAEIAMNPIAKPVADVQTTPPAEAPTEPIAPAIDAKRPAGIKVGTVLTNGESEAKVSEILADRYEATYTTQEGQITILFEEIGKQWSKLPPTK